MKRQVSIFIETDIAQTELEFSRLELFNDEKISVSSTVQNISDISKIFTDFSQGFTIPCSPTNNAIFKHFYQNDVDILGIINFQKRYNAYIEIDTVFFRRGKIQLEKANLKNGKPDSYSVTFYGAGVSLKDFFNEDKLSQLDYSTLDHDYTNQEVFDRVTIDSSTTDYDVRYPLITSKRVWQYGASVPLPNANLPDWYQYPVSNINNLADSVDGKIEYTELFPAVRVASIFNLIESEYSITFNGLFLSSDMFRKAFLWFKNKERLFFTSSEVVLDLLTTTNATIFSIATDTITCSVDPNFTSGFVSATLDFNCTSLSPNFTVFYIDVYNNNSLSSVVSSNTTGPSTQFSIQMFLTDTIQLRIRSETPVSIDINLTQTNVINIGANNIISFPSTATATATTNALTNLASCAPDMKISDFVSGICKEFNLTVYSNTKNVFTFETIPDWYSRGAKFNITEFTDVTSIEIERMKLYKSIEFKYQDSECFMNKFFLENPLNPDAHGYGNLKKAYDYDGNEYKIESPFENLLHNNFGNNLQVGYALNKEFGSYIPKPCLLYMNILTTLTGSDKIEWAGMGNTQVYVPFGQDSEILTTQGLVQLTLNFGVEISSFLLVNNYNSIYALYYSRYLENLYNLKNRLVKVKTILPVSLLTQLQLNDRLIIRDKRYMINEMQSDLTTGDVDFTLISDFAQLSPILLINTPSGSGGIHSISILLTNGVRILNITASGPNVNNITLSQNVFTQDEYLIVTVPANAARTITLTLDSEYFNGDTDTNYIIIEQQ